MGSGAPRNGPPPQGTSVLDSFSVVGAGALAEALVRSLTDLGMTCRGVFARRLEKAQMLADSLGVSTSGRVEQAASTASDLLLIVVTDEAVSEGCVYHWSPGCRFYPLLRCIRVASTTTECSNRSLGEGVETGSFHPLQTFTGPEDKTAFRGITIGMDGSARALGAAQHLAVELLAVSVSIDPQKRALYHAAAVMAGNHAITMLSTAGDLWELAAGNRQSFVDSLGPLTRQSVFNALEKGPESALTGPVVRGDVETIRRHLEALSDYASHLLPMYGAVLTETVHLAMRSGRLAPDSAVKLLDLVSEFLNREAS